VILGDADAIARSCLRTAAERQRALVLAHGGGDRPDDIGETA
jgi:hypothetical protein